MFYHLTNVYYTIWTNGRILFYHSTMCPSYAQSLDKWKSGIIFIRSIFCYLLSQFNRLIGSMHFDKKCCSCPSLHINGGSFFPLHMLIFIGFHFGLLCSLCSFFTKTFFSMGYLVNSKCGIYYGVFINDENIEATDWDTYNWRSRNFILPAAANLCRTQSGVRIQKIDSPSSPPLLDRT